MATGKEIRAKIKSIESTKKITKAMEMVAASKMRKAQERMYAARPYSEKIRDIAANLSQTHPEYAHPFMVEHAESQNVGIILATTDKGLCGGMNTNIFRLLIGQMKSLEAQQKTISLVALGGKGLGFLHRMGAQVVAQANHLGDVPHLEQLIGPIKILLDEYAQGKLNKIYLAYTRFLNTMKQEPVFEQLLPLSPQNFIAQEKSRVAASKYTWDYLYEPDMQSVIDDLLRRYVEALIYQAVAENMASEQSARMVAMKAASDNAGNIIDELKLVYNKTRQAAITKELSEIVAGAAAIQ